MIHEASRHPSDVSSPARRTAWRKLQPALEHLAATLVAHHEDARAPFARLGAPPVAALMGLPPPEAAEQAIALVRAVFHLRLPSASLTHAAKQVGNAALGVKRALAHEAARRARIALREARPLTGFRVPAKGGARKAA
jgi:hypothetical protein